MGILVEPIPAVFARLVEAHRGTSNLAFENVAIDAVSGERSFWYIRPETISKLCWYENKHLSPGDKKACKELLRRHGYVIIKAKDTFAYLH